MAQRALSGLKVVDLTHYLAGPYCTKLLAGFGADVVKVERPPAGDPLRRAGPFFRGQEGTERSIPFLWLNTGKRGVTLNLKTPEGRDVLRRMVREADVLVENFSPRVMPSLGLGYDALRAINPRLVMVSISNYGQSGPYRDFAADELQMYAMCGAMSSTGSADRPPLGCGPALSQYSAGLSGYLGALMAVLQRRATGAGQHVDVSIMECGIEQVENRMAAYLLQGKAAKRGGHMYAPWGLYPCRDGYAAVICGPFRKWTRGAAMFEEPKLLDARYRHVRDRVAHRQEVDALIQPWLGRHTRQEVLDAAARQGLAFGYVAGIGEAMACEQHRARGFFRPVAHPEVGTHPYCGAPFGLSATPWADGRAPLLGEHNRAVYRDAMGFSEADIERWRAEGVI